MIKAADKASKATVVSSKRNREENDGGGGSNPKKPCIVPEAVPQDVSNNIGEGPTRPSVLDSDYASRVLSNTRRKFLTSSYYPKHSWFEYSMVRDAIFCFACRHFATTGGLVTLFAAAGLFELYI